MSGHVGKAPRGGRELWKKVEELEEKGEKGEGGVKKGKGYNCGKYKLWLKISRYR